MKKLLFIPFLFICSMVIGQSSKIIGTPIEIGSLEVAQYDLYPMNWNDAKKACAVLGNGWRLPTKDELNLVYLNKDKIGGFANNYYWSSTEFDIDVAWVQNFFQGYENYGTKLNRYYVRAVRSLK